jgi:1-acyl-sn-glycerol-3-phosphate acyltransferase
MKKRIYECVFFKLMGWKIVGEFKPEIKKCVMMVMPHTSWHDFYLGLFTRGILGIDMHWVGKKELFRFPFGAYFRWMGGAPLDRSGGLNKVDTIAEIFKYKAVFRMAIAPEGTRQEVSELKTGFYYIALKAQVPIIPVAFDYGKKEVRAGNYFYPTGNIDADLQILVQNFIGVKGKIPQDDFDFENFLKQTKP